MELWVSVVILLVSMGVLAFFARSARFKSRRMLRMVGMICAAVVALAMGLYLLLAFLLLGSV